MCIGDTKSALRQLKQSVPQASVGGPILFNFYCSTLTSVIPEDLDIDQGALATDHNLRKPFDLLYLIWNRTLNCNEYCVWTTSSHG